MKTLRCSALGILCTLAMSLNANAVSEYLVTPSTPSYTTFTSPSQNVINQQIQGLFEPDLTLVYKQDVGAASDSGQFASSYSTTFFNTPSDPSDAKISFISGPYLDADDIYLLVKDGNNNPSGYLFDISGWNGTDYIVLKNFWPAQGAISHVSLYARGVPDGGTTLMLLGIALVCLGAARRLSHMQAG